MKKAKNPDPAQVAHRVVSEIISRHEKPLPSDFEAAWTEWSRAIQNIDGRTMALLRAAFEAGAQVARTQKPGHRDNG